MGMHKGYRAHTYLLWCSSVQLRLAIEDKDRDS